ncbi:MAG: zf-HC2 domain-containing protein [Armatimonadetes bacterium]|nr:zf-HC2 domain-containing protein [Armatimonadota bacterium]
MSCEKVRPMLPDYLDGEACEDDAQFIEKHLAECSSCAQEMEVLRRMAKLLQASAEVEPPAGLLERIEAVTIQKRGILERLRTKITTAPQYARLATAGFAVAALLVGILFSQFGGNRPQQHIVSISEKRHTPVKISAKQPTPSTNAKQPVGKPKIIASMPKFKQPRRVATIARKTHVKSGKERKVTEQPMAEKLDEAVAIQEEQATPSSEAAQTPNEATEGSSGATVVAEQPEIQEEVKEPKIAPPKLVVQEDPLAIEQLRKKLAAKNKQPVNIKLDPIDNKKHSVTLVGFRF